MRKHLLDIQHEKISPDEYVVYATLFLLCVRNYKEILNDDTMLYVGQCAISQPRLADRTNLKREKVRYALTKLKQKGLIRWKVHKNGFAIYTVCAVFEPLNPYEQVFDFLYLKQKRKEPLDEDEKYLYDHLNIVYGE